MAEVTPPTVDIGSVETTRESDARLRAALAAMGESLYICDAQGRAIEINDAFVEFHRFGSREQAPAAIPDMAALIEVRTLDGEFVPPEQWAVSRALRGETGRGLEVELRHAMTGERWFGSYNFAPLFDDSRAVMGAVVTARDITSERLAKYKLVEEQARTQLLLVNSDCALWTVDLVENSLTPDNATWLARYGFCPSDTPATLEQWLQRIHPDDIAQVMSDLVGLVEGRLAALITDFRILGADGAWHWLQARAMATSRDAGGRALQLTCLTMNIEESRRAAQVVKDNEERLRLVIQAAELGVWDWDFETEDFTCNEQMTRMLGYAPGDVADYRAWSALVHPADFEGLSFALREHFAGRRSSFSNEVRLRRAGGEWHWVMTRGQIVERDASGRALRMMGVNIDINAQKTTELALATSEARFRTVVDNVPIGIVLSDAMGQTEFANQAFRDILGLSSDDKLSLAWVDRIEEPERETMRRNQAAMLAGEQNSFQIEFRYRRSEDDIRTVRSRVIRVDAPHADFTYIGVGEDVSVERARTIEHERMRQEAQQSQKMEAIGQLTGGIAHDFNNILAAVIGFGDLARRRYVDDPANKVAEYLDRIVQAGERGRDLVKKMLAFSRTSPSDDAGPIHIAPVVHEVAHMLSTIIPSTISFKVSVNGPVRPIMMDAVHLHQAIVNLVVNARDAIEGHGEIVVSIGARPIGDHCSACHAPVDGCFVTISVRDSGCGMDEMTLARIFDPFFTTKDVGHGTGMGLSVVHGVVHQAGGHILVKSRPGAGTEFQLLFPATSLDGAADETRDTTGNEAAPELCGARVLVVDDEAPIRALLKELFEGEGMQVTLAGNGREALDLMRSNPSDFDLVFTDQTMPEMTGVEFVESLRATGLAVPVVLLSGYSDNANHRALERLGARFLNKPILPTEALAAATLALGRQP